MKTLFFAIALMFILSSSRAAAFTGPSLFASRTMSTGSSRLFSTTEAASTSSSATKSTSDDKKKLSFAKYEGLGNDFILIDNRDRTEPSLTPEASQRLCHRNFGIGGDGVIFALQSPDDSQYDYAMRIYNSDGSEPEMCGNGIRCMAQFLQDLEGEESEAKDSYRIHTLAGTIIPVMNRKDHTITVDMGEPILASPDIPTSLKGNDEGNSVVEQEITDLNGKSWKVNAVSMGNPHAIIFVNDLEKDVDLAVDGPALCELTSVFPNQVNVEFVEVVNDSHLKMKVWERGAGPTLACGTGTCALVVAAVRAKKIPPTTTPCRVTLPGGDLWIEWRESDNKVYMTGPATLAFEGTTKMP